MALPIVSDPLDFFAGWYKAAAGTEKYDHTAVALATVDGMGLPDVRMVLLKGYGPDGFLFYTNSNSTKGVELAGNMQAALCFHWKELQRQVRLRGRVELLDAEASDAYFASRDRGSQIGAWASKQSQPLEDRFALEKAVAVETARHGIGKVPRPDYWNGYRLIPNSIEFWQHGNFRLHDRVLYRLEGGQWTGQALYP